MDYNIDNINYQQYIDFEDCKNITEAQNRLSILTNILNKIIRIRTQSKFDILSECGKYDGMSKLSWDNKRVELLSLTERNPDVVELLRVNNWSDKAYAEVKNKKEQVMEDLMALKKLLDVMPK